MADLARIFDTIGVLDYMHLHHAQQIEDLFARLKPKRVVEIGTFHGAGTCYLAELCAEYGGHVTTIDLPWSEKKQPNVDGLVKRCELTNVTIVRREDGAEGWFRDYFADVNRLPLDFIYIDGGHTWAQVVAQFGMAWAALRIGGWVIVDDINCDAWPDVGLAWRTIFRRHKAPHRSDGGKWGWCCKTS
jgi:predicted O-methyltransferase YrrM